jgi:hypothetical protein
MNHTANILKYKKIVCFGDSFTEGQDSGGDNITDPEKTYPSFLSKLSNIECVNLGLRGNSNSMMFIQMLDFIIANKDNLDDTLFLVGLSIIARTYSTDINVLKHAGSDYTSRNIFNNKPLRFKFISPTFEVTTQHEKKVVTAFISESDEIHLIKTCEAMLAMIALAKLHNVDIFFIDVILNISELIDVVGIFDFNMFIPHLLNNVPVLHLIERLHPLTTTASGHLNADGYYIVAEYVYEFLKAKIIENNE